MNTTGFVVGVASEARIVERAFESDSFSIACASADPVRAGQEARQLLAEGAGALVSFGLAGGLDPALEPGALVLAERVRLPGGRTIDTTATWRTAWMERAAGEALPAVGGTLAGSPRVVRSPQDKRDLYAATGAVAVDMESHEVALAAAEAGVPFLVLRAVADPAERTLPSVVVGCIGPDGQPRIGLLAARLMFKPWEIPAVRRLGSDAGAAQLALGRLAGAAGALVRP